MVATWTFWCASCTQVRPDVRYDGNGRGRILDIQVPIVHSHPANRVKTAYDQPAFKTVCEIRTYILVGKEGSEEFVVNSTQIHVAGVV